MSTIVDSAPADFPGTLPEYLVYQALIKLGYDGRFIFQSSQMGGRELKGGTIADFEIPELSLMIFVQGEYWHYGMGKTAKDLIIASQLEAYGYRVIFIDEEDVLANAVWYTKEALNYRDHSKMREA